MMQAERAPSRDCWSTLAVILLLALIARLALWRTAHAAEEDFFITLRYAANIAHGHGFVYNRGERVLGATTPLYTLFLAAVIRVGLNPLMAARAAGITGDLLAAAGAFAFCRACGHPRAGLAAAALCAAAPINLVWATKGMEVGLVAASAVWCWAWWLQGRSTLAWFAAAITVLLRIDGFALAIVLAGATLAHQRRLPLKGLALFAVCVLPWTLYATAFFGSPMPVSVHAKLTVYAWHAASRFPWLGRFLFEMLHNPLDLAVAAGVVAWALFGTGAVIRSRSFRAEPELWPGVWLLLYYGAMALSKVFLFGWYFVPPSPVWYCLSALGYARMIQRFKPPVRIPTWAPAPLCALLLGVTLPRAAATLIVAQRAERQVRIPIGIWLRAHAAPADTVMLEPIGYIGWYSHLRVLDTVGIVSPQVLPFYSAANPSPYHSIWQAFHPEWILLRAGERAQLTRYELGLPASQRLASAYVRAARFPSLSPQFWLYRRR
ncbi:MAG: hypothetical protein KGJ62_00690 [Armatimonadetes bacterium]|nr:hypothetical protein [Armatimonadota bacterium]MDE2205140.1 hypothetical protein [Armatimonadota bacterium]